MFFPGLPALRFPSRVDGNALYRFSCWLENEASGNLWTLAVTRFGRRARKPGAIRTILVGVQSQTDPVARIHRSGMRFSLLRATRGRQMELLPKVSGFFGVAKGFGAVAVLMAIAGMACLGAVFHWQLWGREHWEPYYLALSLSRYLADVAAFELTPSAVTVLFWMPGGLIALALAALGLAAFTGRLSGLRYGSGVYYLGLLTGLPFTLLTLPLARHLATVCVRRSPWMG